MKACHRELNILRLRIVKSTIGSLIILPRNHLPKRLSLHHYQNLWADFSVKIHKGLVRILAANNNCAHLLHVA